MTTRIGIVGGGQLAAFLVQEAHAQGAAVTVLDPEPRCPAALKGAETMTGGLQSEEDTLRLAAAVDLLTVDLEAVNVDALAAIAAGGKTVVPSPDVLRVLTNKLTQKQALRDAGIPTSPFVEFDGEDTSVVGTFGWPAVNKAAVGGYDGRGVAVIENESGLDNVLRVPGFVEAWVEHRMEIAVMVARGCGTTVTYEPVEMVFNPAGNLLDELVAPARISDELRHEAKALAARAIDAVGGDGVFGVELFLTPDNDLLVNEISPRTHNSGHYTMDACTVSQFAQQYRILNGKAPLPTEQNRAAVMINLLGEPGYRGATVIEGLEEIEQTGVHVYIYGKHECFPLRKMGHVTVTAETIDEAMAIVDRIRPTIRIRGAEPVD